MKITNNRGWIGKARKGFNYVGDRDDKQHLINILRDTFGIHAISECVLIIDESPIYPDVMTTDYNPKTYFELHGGYHNQVTGDYTWNKRQKYESGGYNLIEIWEEATDGYEESRVIEVLKAQGIKAQ